MDIAVVIPRLTSHGGAERFALECIKCWLKDHRITLYASAINEALLEEAGINEKVKKYKLTSLSDGSGDNFVLDRTVVPRKWTAEIGRHEIYLLHLFPANLVDKHPSVWCAQEPLRIKHDLRYAEHLGSLYKNPLEISSGMPNADHTNLFTSDIDLYLDPVQDSNGQIPDVIVANSNFARMQLEAIYKTKVRVVYPGISRVHNYTKPLKDKVLLSISSTSWPKRLALILNAMVFINDAKLVHIGSGTKNDTDEIKDLIVKWGLQDRVTLIGEANDTILESYLERCYCVLFAPLREPFGIVPLEALAHGKPIVCVNEGGYTEILNEKCSIMTEPYPERLAKGVNELLSDPNKHESMGRAGIEVAAKYTWSRTATELLDIFKETAATNCISIPDQQKATLQIGFEYYIDYRTRDPSEYTPRNSGVEICPWLGFYKSYQGAIIERHAQWIKETGADFISLEIPKRSHPDTYFLQTADTICRVIETRCNNSIKVCTSLILEDDKEDYDYLDMIIKGFGYRKCSFKMHGKPVVFVRSAGEAYKSYSGVACLINIFKNGLRAHEQNLRVSYICPEKGRKPEDFAGVLKGQLNTKSGLVLARGFNTFKDGFFIEPNNIHGDRILIQTKELIAQSKRQ